MTSDCLDCNLTKGAKLETSPFTCCRRRPAPSIVGHASPSTGRCLETEPQTRAVPSPVALGELKITPPMMAAGLAANTAQPERHKQQPGKLNYEQRQQLAGLWKAPSSGVKCDLNLSMIGRKQNDDDHVEPTTLRAAPQRQEPDRNEPCGVGGRREPPERKFTWQTVAILFAFVLLINPTCAYKSIEVDEAPAIASNELTAGNSTNFASTNSIENIQVTSQSPEVRATSTFGNLLARITSAFSAAPITSTEPTVQEATTKEPTKASHEREEDATQETPETEEETHQDDAGTGDDDHHAEGCQGISADEPAEAKNLTDHERLVNLQTCMQRKVKSRLLGATRSAMELFDRLSLSGGCSASLLKFASALSELKSYAFKFLDASAKIPSGVMFGLLSDFGDFDQCLSIRSDPSVDPQVEAEEGAFSGKYCLLSVRLKYHIELKPNTTVPEGIFADGIFWDELVRNYWTSNSTKGFQMAVCVPSRCNNDDLEQIYRLAAENYNFDGQLLTCQDSNDLRAQLTPDCLQLAIIYTFAGLIGLTLVATLAERYLWPQINRQQSGPPALALRVLVCFSISRNWRLFMRRQDAGYDLLADNNSSSNNNNVDIRLQKGLPLSSQTSGEATQTTNSSRESYCDLLTNQNNNEQEAKRLALKLDEHNKQAELSNTGTTKKAYDQQLVIKIDDDAQMESTTCIGGSPLARQQAENVLSHLSGLKLLVIVWITVGLSFLYPSANNYQYYRSIMSMNITRDSVWFATTNFTLGIDTLLYITGLVFVYKTAALAKLPAGRDDHHHHQKASLAGALACSVARKVVRFWPTYLTIIGIAIVIPLSSDGPMWPEMVGRRLGASCRKNWWANLLIVNNLNFGESEICLPSSWFVSVIMQLFLVGSLVLLVARKFSLTLAMLLLTCLLSSSIGVSFAFAYYLNLRAPVIRMDESFVMELDENIFRLYTNTFNNLGPFLVGMAGGFILLRWTQRRANCKPTKASLVNLIGELIVALLVGSVAVLVLSSVFHDNYSRLASSTYWALHRVGWAIVTGYVVHQCATGKWRLLYDLLSLSTLIPLSRLIFIAYLLYPIFIHVHSGLVRDGLHVSIYNMMNIYITRLALTFGLALLVHLLVELPCCSIEQIWLGSLLHLPGSANTCKQSSSSSSSRSASNLVVHHPLLAVAGDVQELEEKASTGVLIAGKRVHLGQLNSFQPQANSIDKQTNTKRQSHLEAKKGPL